MDSPYAYFVLLDPLAEADFRVMRVCHATSCPGNAASCGITALYEQDIQCGITRQGRASDNNVCLFNFTAINDNMDMRYDGCRAESILETRVAWDRNDVMCRTQYVSLFAFRR